MKTIVVSAVNLNVGGTLTILRECLAYLSVLADQGDYRIVALVHKREVAEYPNIEYIELAWSKKAWVNRLWCEYVTMNKISKELAPVYLWLSLHDTTPNVQAEKQAVYCHNSFPFYKWKMREWLFTPKVVMFSLFSKWIYRINIHKNDFIVVQQQWFRDAFEEWFDLDQEEVIVSPPRKRAMKVSEISKKISPYVEKNEYVFFYPALPNSHKNFEVLCEAAQILSERLGENVFKVFITMKGDENGYARWLYKKWGNVKPLNFRGFLNKEELFQLYEEADALVFPSKIETWGLPITEFASYHKPMLLADLPYTHETSSGCSQVCFFNPEDASLLADKMQCLIEGDTSILRYSAQIKLANPVACSWHELFNILLK